MKTLKPETLAFKKRTVFHDDFKQAYDAIIELMAFKDVDPKVMLIIGENGCGKSRLAKMIQNDFPIVDSDGETIIPIALTDAPPETGQSALVSELLHSLGDLDAFVGRPQKLRDRLRKILRELNVALIIIDEVQDIFPLVGINNSSKATKFIKWLTNKGGAPVLLLGTSDALSLLDVNNALNQRAESTRYLHRFRCTNYDEQLRFANFLSDLFGVYPRKIKGFNFYKKDENGDEVLKDDIEPLLKLCLACEGIPRILNSILSKTLEMTEPEDVIDGKVFGEAWETSINHKNGWQNEVHPFDSELRDIKTELIAKKLFTKPVKETK